MRPILSLLLAVALLPSVLAAAVLPEVEPAGGGTPPDPGQGAPLSYVVITPRRLQGPFMRLVQERTRQGLPAGVVTLEEIEDAYPGGVDLAERIRMFLQDAHANRGTGWVLLGGDASVVPVRRALLRTIVLGDIELPTDQYYACLDGNWNADGDGYWGENPRAGEPGDEVDFDPELFVGRAPVRTAAEAAAFVRRTLDYEARLAAGGSRSALLAADVIQGVVDGAFATEAVRPLLEADPTRQIARLYENVADWPGSLPESRPALLDALAQGPDLAVLVGAGGPGVIVAGQDFCCADYVTSDDMLALASAPAYSVAYVLSCYTTDSEPPLPIGAALMRARDGGAAAVIGVTDNQFVTIAADMMTRFFAEAVGSAAVPVGVALARAIAGAQTSDFIRLSSQGLLLFGDPTLRIDAAATPAPVRGGRTAYPIRSDASRAGSDRPSAAEVTFAQAIRGPAFTTLEAQAPSRIAPAETGLRREESPSRARLEAPTPSPARATVTLRFELPRDAGPLPFELAVFDLLGRRVRTLVAGGAGVGRAEIAWDLRSDQGVPVADGVYHARLTFVGTSVSRRLLVLR